MQAKGAILKHWRKVGFKNFLTNVNFERDRKSYYRAFDHWSIFLQEKRAVMERWRKVEFETFLLLCRSVLEREALYSIRGTEI